MTLRTSKEADSVIGEEAADGRSDVARAPHHRLVTHPAAVCVESRAYGELGEFLRFDRICTNFLWQFLIRANGVSSEVND